MKIEFKDGKNWSEVVDFSALINAILDFIKAFFKGEYGFEF